MVYERTGDLELALEDANTAVNSNASNDRTLKLHRRISKKYAQSPSDKRDSQGTASLDFIGWAIRVAAWDSLLPIVVLATPFLVNRLAAKNRDLSDFVGTAVPLIACIIRAIVGIRHIHTNQCSSVVRKFQYCAFFVALLLLVFVDTMLILTHQQGMQAPDEYLALVCVLTIYFPLIVFAMYPGRKQVTRFGRGRNQA
jgi:hypothetical protein